MKLALAISAPDVTAAVPVALLSGSFAERLQKAASLGCDGVELFVVRPTEADASKIRSQLEEVGLEPAAVGSGAIALVDKLTLLARDADVSRRAVARLDELIDFAAELQSPIVTLGGFRGRLDWAAGRNGRETLIEILRSASEQAAAKGVRLVLEPLNRYETDVVHNAAEGLELVEQVGHSHLGLLLDTFHMNIEETSFADPFKAAASCGRLWHVHLADNNRHSPGAGRIDFAAIVATLRAIGYQGYLSAELLPYPDPDAAAAATLRHMRQFVGAKD